MPVMECISFGLMLRPRRIGRKWNTFLRNQNLHTTNQQNVIISEEMRGHLRWIEQKYLMGQDMILMGLPTALRRQLLMYLAQKNGWEIEYLAITKDTTESDLKQRREIIGDSVVYADQPPVRAAIHGRILVLDGIENAERNVLPTLNNLLENREMSLDDGRFLMPRPSDAEAFGDIDTANNLVFVNKNFRVVALGLPVPPFSGRALDPPLRSRFQVIRRILPFLTYFSVDLLTNHRLKHFFLQLIRMELIEPIFNR